MESPNETDPPPLSFLRFTLFADTCRFLSNGKILPYPEDFGRVPRPGRTTSDVGDVRHDFGRKKRNGKEKSGSKTIGQVKAGKESSDDAVADRGRGGREEGKGGSPEGSEKHMTVSFPDANADARTRILAGSDPDPEKYGVGYGRGDEGRDFEPGYEETDDDGRSDWQSRQSTERLTSKKVGTSSNLHDYPPSSSSSRSKPSPLAEQVTQTSSNEPGGKQAEKEKAAGRNQDDLIGWDGLDDPLCPRNWPLWARWCAGLQIALLTFMVTFASSVYSSGYVKIGEQFGVSEVVATLGLSLFVAGYGLGPLLFSPLSEVPSIGRNPVYIITLIIFCGIQVPTALAGNIGTLLAMRFIGGVFASPALAVGGATLSDLFEKRARASTMAIYGLMPFAGPVFGPIVGGYVIETKNWDWEIWIILWFAGAVLVVLFFFLPETSHLALLRRKAHFIRTKTGVMSYQAASELKRQTNLGAALKETFFRPFELLFLDPIVFLMSLYLALLYGLLYLFLESFAYVFQTLRGFSPGSGGLAFLGILIGAFIGCVGVSFYSSWYVKQHDYYHSKGEEPPPETRLPPMMATCFLIPISMFWFGWSARPPTHWIVPIIGTIPFGTAYFCFFMSVLNYLTDTYVKYVASVLAANDLMRSGFGAGFPLFASAMYYNLGPGWASSILGFIALALCPIAFVFWFYGKEIRRWSKFTG